MYSLKYFAQNIDYTRVCLWNTMNPNYCVKVGARELMHNKGKLHNIHNVIMPLPCDKKLEIMY